MEKMKKDLEIGEYDKYYPFAFYCGNCGKQNHRYIQKGVLLDTIHFQCDKCGCTITGKKW